MVDTKKKAEDEAHYGRGYYRGGRYHRGGYKTRGTRGEGGSYHRGGGRGERGRGGEGRGRGRGRGEREGESRGRGERGGHPHPGGVIHRGRGIVRTTEPELGAHTEWGVQLTEKRNLIKRT